MNLTVIKFQSLQGGRGRPVCCPLRPLPPERCPILPDYRYTADIRWDSAGIPLLLKGTSSRLTGHTCSFLALESAGYRLFVTSNGETSQFIYINHLGFSTYFPSHTVEIAGTENLERKAAGESDVRRGSLFYIVLSPQQVWALFFDACLASAICSAMPLFPFLSYNHFFGRILRCSDCLPLSLVGAIPGPLKRFKLKTAFDFVSCSPGHSCGSFCCCQWRRSRPNRPPYRTQRGCLGVRRCALTSP
jgi:hypothetical protein